MIAVVDASVAAMWFLPEPHSETAATLLVSDHELVAPDLIRLEVGSALLKAVRRGSLETADAAEALARLSAPALRFEPASAFVDAAFAIAGQHGGSIYDAIYIALAQAVDGIVATNDRELAKVASSAGVRTWLLTEPSPFESGS